METLKVKVVLDKDAKMPQKAHAADAGFDLFSTKDVTVPPFGCETIDTGVHMDIPSGYVGFLKSKSGLNIKGSITGEGVIDAGYTGSIVVKLYNDSDTEHRFKAGDKIIQIVILPIPNVSLEQVESVDAFAKSERGDNGFGSSGR